MKKCRICGTTCKSRRELAYHVSVKHGIDLATYNRIARLTVQQNNGEECHNPWRKNPCGSPEITLYIQYHGKILPICVECWGDISKSDREWTR
jgi:hypothetical protein